jgi:hypothetical protein
MKPHVRISIACIVSLLLHAGLLIGIKPSTKPHHSTEQGLLQTTLQLSLNKRQAQPLRQPIKTALAETKKSDTKPKHLLRAARSKSEMHESIQPVATGGQLRGRFRWRPPSTYLQSDMMNAMQLAQLARQREAQAATILTGLSTIAAQLAPIMTTRITCTQKEDSGIDCIPEPQEKERALIVQFFNLSIQAHQLGITENLIRMDFGASLGISLKLRQYRTNDH